MFFEIVTKELLCDNADDVFAKRRMEGFMNIFQDNDNVFIHQMTNNTGNYNVLEGFIWYYQLIHPRGDYCHDLSITQITFTFYSLCDVHFHRIYPINVLYQILLERFCKRTSRRSWPYTPREVMKFMWDRALFGKGIGTEVDKLLGFYPQNCHGHDQTHDGSCGHLPDVPSVLDPCMGIGSFLCEFIIVLLLQLSRLLQFGTTLGHSFI